MNIAKNKNRKLKIFWYNFCGKRGRAEKFDRKKFWARLQLNTLKHCFTQKMAEIWLKNFARDSYLSSIRPRKEVFESFWKSSFVAQFHFSPIRRFRSLFGPSSSEETRALLIG